MIRSARAFPVALSLATLFGAASAAAQANSPLAAVVLDRAAGTDPALPYAIRGMLGSAGWRLADDRQVASARAYAAPGRALDDQVALWLRAQLGATRLIVVDAVAAQPGAPLAVHFAAYDAFPLAAHDATVPPSDLVATVLGMISALPPPNAPPAQAAAGPPPPSYPTAAPAPQTPPAPPAPTYPSSVAPPPASASPPFAAGSGVLVTLATAGQDEDIDHFEVKAIDPSGAAVTCSGTRGRPCRLVLQPGTKSVHVKVVYDGGELELDKDLPALDQSLDGTITNVDHNGARIAGRVLVGIGVGTILLDLGWMLVDVAQGIDVGLVPALSGIAGGGILMGIGNLTTRPDEASILFGTHGTTGTSDSGMRLAALGVVPLRGGGAAATAAFAF